MSADEAELAVSGSLEEPSYRPWPGSKRESELEEEFERMLAGDDETENAQAESEGEFEASYACVITIPRIGKAERWGRYSNEQALLCVRREGSPWVFALGTVTGSLRAEFPGARNLDIQVRYILRQQAPLDEVIERLTKRQRALIQPVLDGQLRPLSPKLDAAILTILRDWKTEVGVALEGIRERVNAEVLEGALARTPRATDLQQEAFSSALHLFSTAWYNLKPERSPNPSEFALELENEAGVIENDIIADDSSVFPGWDRSTYSQRGWWEFHSNDRRLLVKNINVSPQENRTGADLVYVRRNPDVFVLVQYKLLEQLDNGAVIYRPDQRLDGQVTRMLDLERTPPQHPADDDSAEDYRLGQGFTFVKFVLASTVRRDRPGELSSGYYFPSEYARRMLLCPDHGPRGGKVHYVSAHRSLSAETFARLVRDTWVGSAGEATALLGRIFGLRDPSIDIVLAIDEPTTTPDNESDLTEVSPM